MLSVGVLRFITKVSPPSVMNPVPCPLPTIPRRDKAVDISKFEIRSEDLTFEKSIGAGAFAEVWFGKYLPENLSVGIKKIRAFDNKEKETEGYYNEIAVLASIKHPFLLPFVGYTSTEPLCIVTKFIPGGSLYSALRPENPENELTPTQISIIAFGVALGLQYLHNKGLIHRDIKSQNILLDENKYPVVCDFGSSRNKEATRMLTGQGGTANYMAPEFLRAEKYDEKVDVYSFGILLWELITKESPFDGLLPPQIMCSVSLFNKRPEIPQDLNKSTKHLIEKCWDRDPKERPSFTEIVEFLISHHGLIEGTDTSKFAQFVSQFRNVNQQIPINFHQSPKPKHRSIVAMNSQVYSTQYASDTNSIIDSQQALNLHFATLVEGNQSQVNTALTFILNNIDDPALYSISVWPRVLVLLVRAPQAILPRVKELAIALAKNKDILSTIDQVKDLNLYVKPETLDVFLYSFYYFPKLITAEVISELCKLINSKDCGYQAITLLCKAFSLTQNPSIAQRILEFMIKNLVGFASLSGGHLVLRLIINFQPQAVTDEVFVAFVGSTVLENITTAYQTLFVRGLSPGLLQPSLLNMHLVLANYEQSKEVDDLIDVALNFTRVFAMNVTGYNLLSLVQALIECVKLRKSEHACYLLCLFATDADRKMVFTQQAVIDQILGITDENAASILMSLVLIVIKDQAMYQNTFCSPLLPSYFSTVMKASSTNSFFSVCWSIEHLPESQAFCSKLIECGAIDQIINAVCSTQQVDFISFVQPSLLRVMAYGYTPMFSDLSKHLISMVKDKIGLMPCLAILAQLAKFKEQQDNLMANNIIAALSSLNDDDTKPFVSSIFKSLKDGVLNISV